MWRNFAHKKSRKRWKERTHLKVMDESQEGWKQQKINGKNCRKEQKWKEKEKNRRENFLREGERDLEGEVDGLEQTFISCQLVLWCVYVCVVWLNGFRIIASILVCAVCVCLVLLCMCVCVWRAWVNGCTCVVFTIFFSALASRVWLLSLHRGGTLYTLSFSCSKLHWDWTKEEEKLVCCLFCLHCYIGFAVNFHRCMLFLTFSLCLPWWLLFAIRTPFSCVSNITSGLSLVILLSDTVLHCRLSFRRSFPTLMICVHRRTV